MDLQKLFNPKSIAIVGASGEEGKVGNVIAKNILELGYQGEVFLVNPKHNEIFGKKCYKALADIKEDIDLAVIAIPAKFVINEIEANAKKIKNYIVISAGFSETKGEGRIREAKLLAVARENNLNILGPNCLGFIIPRLKLNASFAGGMPEAGNISFVTQSGALAVALMDMAAQKGVKFSNIISIGNKMQIDESDILEYLGQDEKTKVIGMYLEGIKNGLKFIEKVRVISKSKPVIILKAGKSEKAQKAISSHTGALAGSDEIVTAVIEKTGALRAGNLEEFFNLFNLINNNFKSVPNGEAIVITNAGGLGVLTADAFSGKSIQLADMGSVSKEELRKNLPSESSVENPIDLLGDAREDRYEKALEIVLKNEKAGSIICVLTPQDQTPVGKIADTIVKLKSKTNKIILAVFLGGERIEKASEKMAENEICNFKFPDDAIWALDEYYKWKRFTNFGLKEEKQIINEKRQDRVRQLIEKAKSEGRSALYFSEAEKVMELYGVNTVECMEFLPENSKRIPENLKYPIVLKVDSDQVLHKTDKKGVILNIENAKQFKEALAGMRRHFPESRIIAQKMAERGMEIIIGIERDSIFGPIILYGLGGIYTEFLHQVDYLVPPLNLEQIESALLRGKIKFLFQNARGKNYGIEELSRILSGISFLSLEVPEIREFDINPLLIYNNGKKALAVDVKIII